jgi:hypothetical protein
VSTKRTMRIKPVAKGADGENAATAAGCSEGMDREGNDHGI